MGTRVQKTSGERQTETERETDRHTDPEGGGGEERLEADTENALEQSAGIPPAKDIYV